MKHFSKKIVSAVLSTAMLASSAAALSSGALSASAAGVGTSFKDGHAYYKITSASGNKYEVRLTSIDSGLPAITIPKRVHYGNTWYSVTAMDPLIFMNKQSLGEIKIQAPVTSIPFACFSGCLNLLRLELPETLTYLPSNAISNCMNLTELHIPYACTEIDSNAFSGTHLTKLHVHNSLTTFASNAFTNNYYPTNVYTYYGGSTWNYFQTKSSLHDLSLGDVDNSLFVNGRDITKYQRLSNPTADQKRRMDINRDGYVNQADYDYIYDFTDEYDFYDCTCNNFEAWLSELHQTNLRNRWNTLR